MDSAAVFQHADQTFQLPGMLETFREIVGELKTPKQGRYLEG